MRFRGGPWLRFWFEPSSAGDLGVARALFFAGLLVMYARVDFSAWGAVSPAFWMPLPLFTWLHLAPLTEQHLNVLQQIWRLSLFTSAIGLQTRLSQWTAFLIGFYLLGLPHNFGHTFHFDALLVIAMGVLACSRSHDAWSVDAYRAKTTPEPSGEYTWPIRTIQVAMSLVFLAAAIAKLRYGGLAWIFSSNMSIVLTRAAYHVSDADPITGTGLWIAARPWASMSIAAATVLVELTFCLSLFSKRARLVLVPAAFGMLIGIRVLMGPTFGGFLIANVFWVPWTTLLDPVTSRVRRQWRSEIAADGRSVRL